MLCPRDPNVVSKAAQTVHPEHLIHVGRGQLLLVLLVQLHLGLGGGGTARAAVVAALRRAKVVAQRGLLVAQARDVVLHVGQPRRRHVVGPHLLLRHGVVVPA